MASSTDYNERVPFPETPELLPGAFDSARQSQDYTKSTSDADFWGAPSPDLTLSIHGLSPAFASSPSFSFQTGFEFEGVDEDHEPKPPPELPLSPEQTPIPPSAEFGATPSPGGGGFLSPREERNSFLSEGLSGTSGEDSFMDPKMVAQVAQEQEARAARRRSSNLDEGSAPWSSTPPRRAPPPQAAVYDIFGRPLPAAPPMADPFSIIVEPTLPSPRKKSILGSTKSAGLVALAESPRTPNSSTGYWDAYNVTASSALGTTPPRPSVSPLQSLVPTRWQTEPSFEHALLHPLVPPPQTSHSARSSTYTPLSPPLVDLPSFPPRSHSPSYDERPRSRGGMSDVEEEPTWIFRAYVEQVPPRRAPPRSHSIPEGGLGLAARRNLPSTLQQPLATARRGSLAQASPHSSQYPSHHYPTISNAPTSTPTSASTIAPSPASSAMPSPCARPSRAEVLGMGEAGMTSPTRASIISPPRGANMRQRVAQPEGSSSRGIEVELEDLVRRAEKVESRLLDDGAVGKKGSPSRRKDYPRGLGHGKSDSQASKWWMFGLEGGGRSSPSGKRSSSAAEGWSTLGEESSRSGGATRTAEERRLERERRKVREARRKTQDWLSSTTEATSGKRRWFGGAGWKPLLASRRFRWLAGALVALIVLAIILGVVLSQRNSGSSSLGDCVCQNGGTVKSTSGVSCECSCPSAWGGTSCHLNATCTGDSSLPIAQGLLDVATTANTLFSPSFDASRLPLIVNSYLGSTPSPKKTCQSQLDLISLPNLPISSYPTRLLWTEAAVAWGWGVSEAKTGLRTFASALNFSPFGDEASTVPNSNYQMIVAGLTFDLAQMTSSIPAVSWVSKASPSAEQVALVSSSASSTLDRMASYAVAGSKGRTTALQHLWSELGLADADLATFKSALQDAEVLVPFEATGSLPTGETMMSLAQGLSNTSSFPVGVGCMAGLSGEELSRVIEVEQKAFGLAALQVGGSFNASSCLDRPLYGILNLLNLRLPFASTDNRTSLPSQAITLSSDAKARCTLHGGETLVGALAGSPSASSSSSSADQFGTFANLDHVLLAYLNLLTAEQATELASFVLSSTAAPPNSTSSLLGSLPIFEVQLWGGLSSSAYPSSVASTVSSLSTTSAGSTLLFGTSAGTTFRSWATNMTSEVRWALSAEQTEAQVVDVGTSASLGKVWAATGSSSTPAQAWARLEAAGLVS
ncbi:hypothetical protein BCR35DRAFT_304821 [Leucosporidium creatinivorum]|uniref:EGF-like domain-containing protein n=1 Tax=Leucosporidium creatinivorum TaxID=106004 RepID=A0A1Y2F4M2_9BASI|nr:hypothetical protein BCR35DRAFT_304821 [Leucosporidium creatinivorum]